MLEDTVGLSSASRLNLILYLRKLFGGCAAKPCASCATGQTTHNMRAISRLLRKQIQAQVRRYSHTGQDEHGQERQKWGPAGQKYTHGLLNNASY